MSIDIFGTQRRAVPPAHVALLYFCTTAEGNKVLTLAPGPLRCCVPVSLCPWVPVSVPVAVGSDGLCSGGQVVPAVLARAHGM